MSAAADIISTVQFNHDGEFLATGDKGGRVVIFQRDGTKMRVRGGLGYEDLIAGA